MHYFYRVFNCRHHFLNIMGPVEIQPVNGQALELFSVLIKHIFFFKDVDACVLDQHVCN